MSFDVEKLYSLLPAIYRIRDSELGYPLKEFLSVIAEQIAVLEEDLAQLYDDQFIETCTEWVVPYIGDLIGVRGIHSLAESAFFHSLSQRAQVANTIAYRRRKGTTTVLEQLARDVTNWDVKVVEFFKLLATTQYMNHLRPGNLYSPDLRKWQPLEMINTPFESLAHTIDVRHISSRDLRKLQPLELTSVRLKRLDSANLVRQISRRRGKYNIPNIGIFLWRLRSYSLTDSPACEVGEKCYTFNPLGFDTKLFNSPKSKDQTSQTTESINVAMPISRRELDQDIQREDPDYYGKDSEGRYLSLSLKVDGNDIDNKQISICDLSGPLPWAHHPKDKYGIDPILGRITLPKESKEVRVLFHYGFSADMGGGEYERAESFALNPKTLLKVLPSYANLQTELKKVEKGGTVELLGSGRYIGNMKVEPLENCSIELRAANGSWPLLVLNDASEISLKKDSEVILNGFLILGGDLKVTGLGKLKMSHCTLVPSFSPLDSKVNRNSQPTRLIIKSPITVEIDKCILGGLKVHQDAVVNITNSIVDAMNEKEVAYSGPYGTVPGGTLKRMENCTIIGKVNSKSMEMVSNVIFFSGLLEKDTWQAPVISQRLQQGCVRFSYVPLESQVPRRYRCIPATRSQAAIIHPQFTSLRYSDPGYCQLGQCCPIEIRQGADDESEMGAFHDLFQPQRETNLRVRLEEYLRFGMEAGIFYES